MQTQGIAPACCRGFISFPARVAWQSLGVSFNARSSAEAVVTPMPQGGEPVRLAGGRGRLPGLWRGAGPGRSSGLLGRSIGA
jgi:hypothetical protein